MKHSSKNTKGCHDSVNADKHIAHFAFASSRNMIESPKGNGKRDVKARISFQKNIRNVKNSTRA